MESLTASCRRVLLAGFLGTLLVRAPAAVIYTPVEPAETHEWIGGFYSMLPAYDINGDGVGDFQIVQNYGFFLSPQNHIEVPSLIFRQNEDTAHRLTHVKRYDGGDIIGSSFQENWPRGISWLGNDDYSGNSYFNMASLDLGGDFLLTRGYLGFRMELAPGEYHYGWLSVYNATARYWIIQLGGYAWESDPNVPIIAGAVPEPGAGSCVVTAGLLLLGWRRRGIPQAQNC